VWQVANRLFLGGTLDINGTNASELNPMMAANPVVVDQGTQFLNFGLGPLIQYDSRDIPQNAFKGVFLEASLLLYLEGLGKHDTYTILDLDYRQYLQIGRLGQTLCWHVRLRNSGGDVPWTELPQIGGGNDLRGYREGQYRDNGYIYGVVEYRHMFTAGTNADGSTRLSKHGVVLWAGLGFLRPSFAEFSPALPTIGIGYRLAVQGRLALRLDYGTGRFESQGFYFNFGEAF
jgi:outer membrane protein assembly factor BamA